MSSESSSSELVWVVSVVEKKSEYGIVSTPYVWYCICQLFSTVYSLAWVSHLSLTVAHYAVTRCLFFKYSTSIPIRPHNLFVSARIVYFSSKYNAQSTSVPLCSSLEMPRRLWYNVNSRKSQCAFWSSSSTTSLSSFVDCEKLLCDIFATTGGLLGGPSSDSF